MADLKDILNDDDHIENDDLLRYIQGKLSPEEQHRVEKQMAGSPFVDDAMEGLQSFAGKKNIQTYVDELNRKLQQQVANKKQRKEKRRFKDQPWITMAVATILALALLAYLVIYYYQKQQQPKAPTEIISKK